MPPLLKATSMRGRSSGVVSSMSIYTQQKHMWCTQEGRVQAVVQAMSNRGLI